MRFFGRQNLGSGKRLSTCSLTIRESGARLLRACASNASPGTSIFGRALRVRDGLGQRLASARKARGAPLYVPERHYCPPARRAYLFKFLFLSPATGPITLEKVPPPGPMSLAIYNAYGAYGQLDSRVGSLHGLQRL
jgi:hypothetical protein